jgi:hypothetical protein
MPDLSNKPPLPLFSLCMAVVAVLSTHLPTYLPTYRIYRSYLSIAGHQQKIVFPPLLRTTATGTGCRQDGRRNDATNGKQIVGRHERMLVGGDRPMTMVQ